MGDFGFDTSKLDKSQKTQTLCILTLIVSRSCMVSFLNVLSNIVSASSITR